MLRVIERVKFMPRTCVGLVIVTILSFVISGAHIAGTAAADTTNINYNVSVAPALTLTTTTNSMVLNLDPSTKTFDSKNITVGVGTNNKTGYTLTLSTPQDSTDLVRDNSEDGVSGTMPTLAAGTYTQSTFTENKWGYKITSNTSIPGTVTTDYIPFTSGNTLMESDTAKNSDEASLTFAAKIDYLQASGSYSTTLNFHLVANPLVTYIQDVDYTMCTTEPTAYPDKRDGQEYTVALIGNTCWMTQNLRYVGDTGSTSTSMIMKADTSNIASDQNLTIGDLTSGNDYNNARIHDSGNTTNGVWYNYAAASAMSITGSSNSNTATQDICPKGWRLPTYDEQVNIITQVAAYAPITGGYYGGGKLADTSLGTWWASTAFDTTNHRRLNYRNSGLNNGYGPRVEGSYIRCVLKPQSMQSFTAAQASAMSTGETRIMEDIRDVKTYTVAKLADGNVWMTENLNLAGGTALSADDTDVTSEYISGFTTGGNLTKNANNTISLPASTTSGFNYNDSYAYVYNSTKTGTDCSSPGCYGYYSWIAATLGGKQADGSTTEERNGYNAAASICPKGWKLPTATTSNAPVRTSPNWKTGDFYKLATAYGANLESSSSESSATFYNNAGPGKLPNFLLAGYYFNASFSYGGTYGQYWSSSSDDSSNAYFLYLGSSHINITFNNRRYGVSVRCLFNPGS